MGDGSPMVCENAANPALAGCWCTCYDEGDPSHVHVHPLGDVVDHALNDDGDCVCGPRSELVQDASGDDAWVITHHSLDGREQHERPADGT